MGHIKMSHLRTDHKCCHIEISINSQADVNIYNCPQPKTSRNNKWPKANSPIHIGGMKIGI